MEMGILGPRALGSQASTSLSASELWGRACEAGRGNVGGGSSGRRRAGAAIA